MHLRAYAEVDLFLHNVGTCLKRQSMAIHTEILHQFESGTFDIAHLESWRARLSVD